MMNILPTAAATLVFAGIAAATPAQADFRCASEFGSAVHTSNLQSHTLEVKNPQGQTLFYSNGVQHGLQLQAIAREFCGGRKTDFPIRREEKTHEYLGIGPSKYECDGIGGQASAFNGWAEAGIELRDKAGKLIASRTKLAFITGEGMAARHCAATPK